MQTAHLTHSGHLIIPPAILEACHLNAGQELEIEITAQGILLKILGNLKHPNLSAIDAFRGKGKGGAASRLLADRQADREQEA